MKGFTHVENSRIAGAAGIVVAAAATALVLGATPAAAQGDGPSGSAYAFSASGLLDIDPVPSVESTDGELVEDELIGLGERTSDAEASGIALGVLTAEAEAGRAQAAVARVELLDVLRADLVRTWCDGDDAGLEIVNGTLLGEELPRFPVAGETIDVSPLVRLTLNDQDRDADGTVTVTGVEVEILPGAGDDEDERVDPADVGLLNGLLGEDLPLGLPTEDAVAEVLGLRSGEALQTIVVGRATCPDGGDGGDHTDDGGDGGDDHGGDADAAPAPTVVVADLPVTG